MRKPKYKCGGKVRKMKKGGKVKKCRGKGAATQGTKFEGTY